MVTPPARSPGRANSTLKAREEPYVLRCLQPENSTLSVREAKSLYFNNLLFVAT